MVQASHAQGDRGGHCEEDARCPPRPQALFCHAAANHSWLHFKRKVKGKITAIFPDKKKITGVFIPPCALVPFVMDSFFARKFIFPPHLLQKQKIQYQKKAENFLQQRHADKLCCSLSGVAVAVCFQPLDILTADHIQNQIHVFSLQKQRKQCNTC